MQCTIYKGRRKQHTYLYVAGGHDLSRVPEALLQLLGKLEHVMDLELTPQRKLAQEDVAVVMRHLSEKGWYLQLPPDDEELRVDH